MEHGLVFITLYHTVLIIQEKPYQRLVQPARKVLCSKQLKVCQSKSNITKTVAKQACTTFTLEKVTRSSVQLLLKPNGHVPSKFCVAFAAIHYNKDHVLAAF
jgi:hypothetical protein